MTQNILNMCSFVKTDVWTININAGDTKFLGLLQSFWKITHHDKKHSAFNLGPRQRTFISKKRSSSLPYLDSSKKQIEKTIFSSLLFF